MMSFGDTCILLQIRKIRKIPPLSYRPISLELQWFSVRKNKKITLQEFLLGCSSQEPAWEAALRSVHLQSSVVKPTLGRKKRAVFSPLVFKNELNSIIFFCGRWYDEYPKIGERKNIN